MKTFYTALALLAGSLFIVVCGMGIKACAEQDKKNMASHYEIRNELFNSGVICRANPWSDSHEFERLNDKQFICKRCGIVKP